MAVCCLTFMVACSSGGGSNDALNPYGFVVASYDSTSAPTLTSNDVRALEKPSTNSSTVFVGTGNGLFTFNSSAAAVFSKRPDVALTGKANQINNLVKDGTTGDMYICTDGGLFKYTKSTDSIAAEAAFAGEKVLSLAIKSTTEFWVGLASSTNCIAKSDSGTVTFYGSAQGIVASSVRNIYTNDTMVVACGVASDTTATGGLFRYYSGKVSGKDFVQIPANVGLAKGATSFFIVGTTWYAGGPDSGLISSTDNGLNWTQTALNNCTPVDFDSEIMNSLGTTRYWVSTDKALYLTYDLINFQPYDTTKNMAGNSTSNVLSFTQGSIWAANDGASGGLSSLAFDGN